MEILWKFSEAKEHIKFVIGLYEQQWREGRWFIHERPIGATSWDLLEIRNLENKIGLNVQMSDAKTARFVTNSMEVCMALQKHCDAEHVHQEELCSAICLGLMKESRNEKQNIKCLMKIQASDKIEEFQDDGLERRERGIEHEDEGEANAWDDITGERLDPKEIYKARMKEMEYVRRKGVWKKISREEAKRRGIKIIKTKWIDTNKGDRFNPNMRSRFVAKEFNNGKSGDAAWFAATPPLEALKLILSDAATIREGRTRRCMMMNDIARAYFEAPVKRPICIELPEEDLEEGETQEDMVGELKKSLYGTRDAAANFQDEVKLFLKSLGFIVGRYSTSTFWHAEKDIKTIVHGDDFASSGEELDLHWLKMELEKRFEVKTQLLGHGVGLASEGKILNRIVRATKSGWEYEADQRHGEVIIQALGLERANGVTSPGEDSKTWQEEEDATPLHPITGSEYRALAARANFLAIDRPDIEFAVKEICRTMANPTTGDMKKIKRLARYLKEVPRLVSRFDFQKEPWEIEGFSDSDWAGCKRTARSTSGGAIMAGKHLIKSWSSTQKNITLSSGEAELVAAVKMSTELIGILQLLEDWGVKREARVYVDSSAAIGITQRRGNGKLRQVKVGMLWIQENVENGELNITKVLGTENPADAMTKHLPGRKIQALMQKIGQEGRSGRSELSLQL